MNLFLTLCDAVRSPQQEDEHAMEQLRARGAGNVIEASEVCCVCGVALETL